MAWRENWQPATFRGVEFKVDTGAKVSGRRGVLFEFPKRDEPYFEDMGRRARRWAITGYVIGQEYQGQADALERALTQLGPAMLVHPTMGTMRVAAESYTRGERKTEGGYATFDMTFVEAGSPMATRISENTQGLVDQMSSSASNAAVSALKKQLNVG
jgi:prophage DNA circulation protein